MHCNYLITSGTRNRFHGFLSRQLSLHSKCICATSGCKSVTVNGFSDIDFLYDENTLAVRRCFSPILGFFNANMQLRPHFYFRFKIWCHNLFEFNPNFLYNTDAPTFGRRHRFLQRDDNVCACAVSALILLLVANFSPEMDSAIPISYETRTFRL